MNDKSPKTKCTRCDGRGTVGEISAYRCPDCGGSGSGTEPGDTILSGKVMCERGEVRWRGSSLKKVDQEARERDRESYHEWWFDGTAQESEK